VTSPVKQAKIVLGAGVWSTDPTDFNITTSDFLFINTSENYDVKMEFTSGLISPNPIEISAGGDFLISIANGKEDGTKAVLWTRETGTSDPWNLRTGVGSGPNMDIDNP
jgi:hypothetical protein